MTGATIVMMMLIGAMIYGIGTGQYLMAALAILATGLLWEEQ